MATRRLTVRPESRAPRTMPGTAPAALIPRWPFVILFACYPLWWVIGAVDVMWIPVAAILLLYLVRRTWTGTPRGFGAWLLSIACNRCSANAGSAV